MRRKPTMTQEARLAYLIRALWQEQYGEPPLKLPDDVSARRRLLRTLFNRRPPWPADEELLRIQDAYLRERNRSRGVTDAAALAPVRDRLCLWRGDITTLKADAIVNAANSALLGCFIPCHRCIDNAIHTYAGIQLRLSCARLMRRQAGEEPVGQAKITPAFNLPGKSVLHTVGPRVNGRPTSEDCRLLASCYRSCLTLAVENGARSLALCCLATGEFHFPRREAAAIAVRTTEDFIRNTNSRIQVIFNVYTEEDDRLYRALLTENTPS